MTAITSWKPPAPAPTPPSPYPSNSQFEGLGMAPHRPIARSVSSVAFSGRDVVRLHHTTPRACLLHMRISIPTRVWPTGAVSCVL